jgi:DNA-binding NtrC family response regulator
MVDQLRCVLETDYGRHVETVHSYHEAELALEQQQYESVFIDFRRAAVLENPTGLLQRLGHQGEQLTPVIAISDGGYVCDWAAVADMIVSGHIQLPLDHLQLARLLKQQVLDSPPYGTCTPAIPKVVQGETVNYKTYMPRVGQLLDDLVTMATHDVTILLVGETGTGKTTLARLIHELSARSEARFLTVACGALPAELIESELFGHVKGAFTSADHTKPGKFDVAQSGSLLLDEIDVLGLAQQAKLLRVIETGEYEPVGSNETRTSKARLIVASNVDLAQLMQQDRFRADLYYRLNMLECRIPPLRERPRDIVPMALDFVGEFCTAHQVEIRRVHPDFLACLKSYRWPGNVRELKNHVRRAVLFCRDGVLTPTSLAVQIREAPIASERDSSTNVEPSPQAHGTKRQTLFQQVADSEIEILQCALDENGYNRTETAKSLGLSRVGLYKKMKKYGMIQPQGAVCNT